jgi:hypothetical protein
MNIAGPTIFKNAIAVLVVAFFAGVANGQSQSPQEDPNTPPLSVEQRDAERQPTPEPVPAPLPVPNTPPDQSPFDYRSSEEISEDRSVSFPVDI